MRRDDIIERLRLSTFTGHPKSAIGSCEAREIFVTLWSRDSMKITVKACQMVQTRSAL
jgi:hypothetical protein